MIKLQHEGEIDRGIIILYHKTENYVEIDDKEPSLDPQFIEPPKSSDTRPNLSSGMAAYCLDTIVQHQDLMDARKCIENNKMKDKLLVIG